MKIHDPVKLDISDLIEDESNPNVMTPHQMRGLQFSLKKFGMVEPLIVGPKKQGKHTVYNGNHRLAALKKAGIKDVYGYIINKPETDIKLLRQITNKLHGKHDPKLDKLELNLIAKTAPNEAHFAVPRLFIHRFEAKEAKEIPQIPKSAKSGETWQLGRHKITCGRAEDTPEGNYDLMLTDPPYGINVVKSSNHPKKTEYKDVLNDDKPFDPAAILKHGKKQIIFGGNHFAHLLPPARHWLVWDKKHENGNQDKHDLSDAELIWTNIKRKNVKMLRHMWFGMLAAGDAKLNERFHPTQKPVELILDIVERYTEPGQTVLDPYLGSGSTLLACEMTGRTCIGTELDPEYIDVIIHRWEQMTGKKAEKA